jgi:hypothetical protein
MRRARRDRIRDGVFPDAWRSIISDRLSHYHRLSRSDRSELEKQVLVFLTEKIFEGCGGLTLTDEVTVTIAAQACILSLRRDLDYYPDVKVILVYPGAYRPRYPRHTIPRPEWENTDMRLGEARGGGGVVVISWSGVADPGAELGPHRNLTVHEFAHQIDMEDGAADGIPVLDSSSTYRTWAGLVAEHFADHVAKTEAGIEGVIDPYGSRNPAEFFAVAVEAFFENPTALRQERPSLYDLLRGYFGQDPASAALS